ncbi:MAG: transporter substrate-binding domain-containing protein [Lachnospiraceae bacterium]|nr:transporter substrate-binding domain-containing protein [Lachnospiraceae bacterium]
MKNKTRFSIILTAIMIMALITGCGGSQPGAGSSSAASSGASDAPSGDLYLGTLSLLNMTEDEYLAITKGKVIANEFLEKQGVYTGRKVAEFPQFKGVKFYDTLDAMVMALEAGDILSAEMPKCTADYLCAHNDKLSEVITYNTNKADDFSKKLLARMEVGYSFMLKESNTALRDEIDKAIGDMKTDGTLKKLIKEYINDGVFSEQKEVKFDKVQGDTIRIAVTGSVPPMDYVAPDGKFAGFNTAMCAELGKRLKKNIELVQVDSMGRAAALSSGQVDAVFWTIGLSESDSGIGQNSEEFEKTINERKKNSTEEQNKVMEALNAGMDFDKRLKKDRPDGTIITQPYYSDLLIPVGK